MILPTASSVWYQSFFLVFVSLKHSMSIKITNSNHCTSPATRIFFFFLFWQICIGIATYQVMVSAWENFFYSFFFLNIYFVWLFYQVWFLSFSEALLCFYISWFVYCIQTCIGNLSLAWLSVLWLTWQVDYSGFMTINPQRFGQKYVGKVTLFCYSSWIVN